MLSPSNSIIKKAVLKNDEEVRIQLNVFISHEFKMMILSYGENVKVLTPASLKK